MISNFIGEVATGIQITTKTSKRIQGDGAIMATQAKFRYSIWLSDIGLEGGARVGSKKLLGGGVIPKRGCNLCGIGMMGGMACLAYFIFCPDFPGKIMSASPDSDSAESRLCKALDEDKTNPDTIEQFHDAHYTRRIIICK